MKKNILIVLSLLLTVNIAHAVIIVDDNLEGAGDAVADYAGQIVIPWAGCGSRNGTYWRFNNHNDEEPGVGVDGDGLPLEVVNGYVGQLNIGLDGSTTAPQTVTVTYAGAVERGVYTIRMQAGALGGLKQPLQANEAEITLGGMLPISVDAPIISGDHDVIWTLVFEPTSTDVGQPLKLQIHVPSLTHHYYFTLDHVEIQVEAANKAMNPSPYSGQGIDDYNFAPEGGNPSVDAVVLSWESGLVSDSVDPNALISNPDVTKYYLYVNNDANLLDVSPIEVPVVNDSGSHSLGVIGYDVTTFWRVDQSIDDSLPGDEATVTGRVWSFATIPTEPIVDAGPDLYASLELGQSGIPLNGFVIDGDNSADTPEWTVFTDYIGYPGGIQSFGEVASPVTTFMTDRAGRYILKLSVLDPSYPGVEYSDIIEVIIVEDACGAAKGSPGGYMQHSYDFNNDCFVNLQDFAEFAADWLDDRALYETLRY